MHFDGGQGSFLDAGRQAAKNNLFPRVAIIFPLRQLTREERLLLDDAILRLGSAYYAPAGEKERCSFLVDSVAEQPA